jgi:hypothetical protein
MKRFLIACHDIVLAGGLLRFERFGRVARELGNTLAYVVFSDNPKPAWTPDFSVLTAQELGTTEWDAVFVPGAGFPDPTIEKFKIFREQRFGVRVQHILNDQTRRAQFMAVNRSFSPHVVIFNNEAWPPGSFTDFMAERFHTILGAVDIDQFRPLPNRSHPLTQGQWTVGGLANKNPLPLVEAVSRIPSAAVTLFGNDRQNLAARYPDLIEQGKLRLVGRRRVRGRAAAQ